MGGFEIDDRELREYAVTLTAAAAGALGSVVPVMSKAALNIKRQHIAEMGESASFRGTARSIGYDITVTPAGITAEIGPDKERGGALANIAYFGSPSNPGGASVPDPLLAAEAEYPALERFLGDVLEGPL
jgi:hypothetical protein